jgi:hypothetical protein
LTRLRPPRLAARQAQFAGGFPGRQREDPRIRPRLFRGRFAQRLAWPLLLA